MIAQRTTQDLLERLKSLITPEQWDEARGAWEAGSDIADLVQERQWLRPRDLLELLEDVYAVPGIHLGGYHPDREAMAIIREDVCRRLMVLPLFILRKTLFLAMADPVDVAAQDYVQQLTGLSVETLVAVRSDLHNALNRRFLSAEQATLTMGHISRKGDEKVPQVQDSPVLFEDRDAPAIRLVDHILSQAVRLRASDVHLECYANRVQLRYRVDGILHEFPPPPAHLYPAVISRIKIAAGMDIAERRLPQDGRMTIEVDKRTYDLRIAIIPNLHGEGAVIRILNTGELDRDLTELGFDPEVLAAFERTVRRPYGMVLVTGPTGSGKTTTLYATLKHIHTVSRKFVTIEDPIEFQLDGITQIQVRADIGLDFADGLRSILRYDPDIVMVGEIRDLKSAEIALRAALTGHTLLSTLHTNNSALAITRLMDMGLQGFQVLGALNGVLAQRLVRRLCPNCKGAYTPEVSEWRNMDFPGEPPENLFRAVGCVDCGNLGYRGRVAIYEFLEITGPMRRLKDIDITPERILDEARHQGFTSLRESAIQKLCQGVTSVSEVVSLTTEE